MPRLLTRLRAAVAAAIAGALFASLVDWPSPLSAQAPESPCEIRTTERVVAVGDVHGAYDQFTAILRTAGLIDRRDRWIGGRARLVQTGDVLDRGPDSRKVLDLLRRLERDAARDGGRVHALLGNHEFMRLVGDWRYVSAREFRAFENADSQDLRERAHELLASQAAARARAEKREFNAREYRTQFLKEVRLGYFELRAAFDDTGEYGRWLRQRVAVVKINDVLFLHGGISDKVADLGCDGVNKAVAADMASLPIAADEITSLLSSTADGPLWYRGMASEPEATFAPVLDSILQRMRASAVVIGHTPVVVPAPKITTRHGGRVVLIDTGMLGGEFYPGGRPSALELHGDAWTAIYESGREPLQRK